MIRIRARIVQQRWDRILADARFASIRSLADAGAFVMRLARATIIKSKKASPPGQPPRTRRGAMRRAIRYEVENSRQVAVIGPSAEVVGISGIAHEFGGSFRGDMYPDRPFMGPALERGQDKLADFWASSIR